MEENVSLGTETKQYKRWQNKQKLCSEHTKYIAHHPTSSSTKALESY